MSASEASAADIEAAKEVTLQTFQVGMERLLNLAAIGYPRAVRSSLAKAHAELRKSNGDQDAAAEEVRKRADALKEDAKMWLVGLVPFVGLPTSLLLPAWRSLRRLCLVSAVYGHDLSSEAAKARIVYAFGGKGGVPAAEFALEKSLQAVWKTFAGPVAKIIPVGSLVTCLVDVEGAVMTVVGRETFGDGSRIIPPEEYADELDAEPDLSAKAALLKDASAYALVQAWQHSKTAVDIAMDSDRRSAALAAGKETAAATAAHAGYVGGLLAKGMRGLGLSLGGGYGKADPAKPEAS